MGFLLSGEQILLGRRDGLWTGIGGILLPSFSASEALAGFLMAKIGIRSTGCHQIGVTTVRNAATDQQVTQEIMLVSSYDGRLQMNGGFSELRWHSLMALPLGEMGSVDRQVAAGIVVSGQSKSLFFCQANDDDPPALGSIFSYPA